MTLSPPRGLGRVFACVAVALALAGCATTTRPLMPTPMLYVGPEAKPLFGPSTERQSPDLDLLFITDRAPATDPDDPLPYSALRSRSIAFGSTTVEFGDGVTWDELAKESTTPNATRAAHLDLGPTKELGRFPLIPYELQYVGSGISRAPD